MLMDKFKDLKFKIMKRKKQPNKNMMIFFRLLLTRITMSKLPNVLIILCLQHLNPEALLQEKQKKEDLKSLEDQNTQFDLEADIVKLKVDTEIVVIKNENLTTEEVEKEGKVLILTLHISRPCKRKKL